MRFGIFFELSVPRPLGRVAEHEVYMNALEQCRRRRLGSLSPARGILVAAAIGLILWLVVLLVVHAIG